MNYERMIRPLLFRFDSESVHHCAVRGAKVAAFLGLSRVAGALFSYHDPILEVVVFGQKFRNPLGLAAGFDKNAEILPFLSHLGFGHIEVGTVTPLAQPGNPRPRIFRLPSSGAIINRMGFPSGGCQLVKAHLERALKHNPTAKIAINIGKNKATELSDAHLDYGYLAKHLGEYAGWLTINISSPNTPGLRSLQTAESLARIIGSIRENLCTPVPLLVKISPDLKPEELSEVLDAIKELKCDGVIASNTTLKRGELIQGQLIEPDLNQEGGLSGPPLLAQTRERLNFIRSHLGADFPIIAVGGVTSWKDFVLLIIEGATLVQGYTALIYQGPMWPKHVLEGTTNFCRRHGLSSVTQLLGKSELIPDLVAN